MKQNTSVLKRVCPRPSDRRAKVLLSESKSVERWKDVDRFDCRHT